MDALNSAALMERAEMSAVAGDYERAIEDAQAARRATQSADASLLLARIYAQAGRNAEALQTLDALDAAARQLPETIALRNAILASGAPDAESRAALEKLLGQEPRNAALLARLGALYRTDDPARAVEYYRRALEIEPRNADYATGYGAALVQARRFAEAVAILRQGLAVKPNEVPLLNNLLTALCVQGAWGAAAPVASHLAAQEPDRPRVLLSLAGWHRRRGEAADAERYAAAAEPRLTETDWYDRALLAVVRGNADEALRCLERAAQAPGFDAELTRRSPAFDAIRGDPRFEALLAQS
jgi:tetratricopeptide (TPR) repeat protein